MKIFRCPECKSRFLECELTHFKISENIVGEEPVSFCPKCLRKRKNPKLIKLEEEK